MKSFYYMGHNPQNLSGVSWKIWKINRTAKTVTVWWGAAELKNRKPIAVARLQSKKWTFSSEQQAKKSEMNRIQEKLDGGYEKVPLIKKGK